MSAVKTIGIIGGGQLGLMIIEQAHLLGARTICLDPAEDAPAFKISDERIVGRFDDPAALEELCRRSDVVTYEFENVPGDLLEAAAIDGATGAQALFRVNLPMVMPSITICTFLTLTNGFKLFDQNLVLTGGQPFTFQPDGTIIRSTEMLALNIYNTFYLNANSRGMGQAKAVLFFILVAAIALIQLRATHSREVQQ